MLHLTLDAPDARTATRRNSTNATREFLAFRLDGQDYGIDILRTQEIRSFDTPVRLPDTPAHLLGMLQLRGSIVPIVDLRLHFRLADPAYDAVTAVILVQAEGRAVGLVVDAVSDVVALTEEQLRAPPPCGAARSDEHLLAIGVLEDRTLMLLDVDKLLAAPSLALSTATH
jgi:purine-binding chemotaxis protein CheW